MKKFTAPVRRNIQNMLRAITFLLLFLFACVLYQYQRGFLSSVCVCLLVSLCAVCLFDMCYFTGMSFYSLFLSFHNGKIVLKPFSIYSKRFCFFYVTKKKKYKLIICEMRLDMVFYHNRSYDLFCMFFFSFLSHLSFCFIYFWIPFFDVTKIIKKKTNVHRFDMLTLFIHHLKNLAIVFLCRQCANTSTKNELYRLVFHWRLKQHHSGIQRFSATDAWHSKSENFVNVRVGWCRRQQIQSHARTGRKITWNSKHEHGLCSFAFMWFLLLLLLLPLGCFFVVRNCLMWTSFPFFGNACVHRVSQVDKNKNFVFATLKALHQCQCQVTTTHNIVNV